MFGGSNSCITVRAGAIPTSSYVLTSAVTALMSNQLVFNIDVTLGAATNIKVKALFSNDGNTSNTLQWFTEGFVNNGSGTTVTSEWQAPVYERVYTFVASGRYAVAVPIKAKWFCAAVQGTGTLTSSTVAIMANVGVA